MSEAIPKTSDPADAEGVEQVGEHDLAGTITENLTPDSLGVSGDDRQQREVVVFTKSNSPYTIGEVAAVPVKAAHSLKRRKIAITYEGSARQRQDQAEAKARAQDQAVTQAATEAEARAEVKAEGKAKRQERSRG